MKKNTFVLLTILSSFLFLMGCENTAAGFGKDMEQSGQAIQKAVNDNNKSNKS